MKPEERLLIAASRPALRPENAEQIRGLFKERLEWDRLIEMASREGLSGLLYAHLKRLGLNRDLPKESQSILRKAYYRNLFVNGLLRKGLEEVLAALGAEGVAVMLLQGAALLEKVYPSAGMRPMCDLDLLIHREDLPVALAALGRIGYSMVSRYPVVCSKDGIVLDLHTEVVFLSRIGASPRSPIIESEALYRSAIPWQKASGTAWTPSHNDLILTLACHLQKHSFSRLIWFADLVGLLDPAHPIHWEELTERAKALKVERPLYFVLSYLKEILEVPIPDQGLEMVRPCELKFAERQIHKLLLRHIRVPGCGDVLFLSAMPSTWDRMRFLMEITFPRQEVMSEISGHRNPLTLYLEYPKRAAHLLGLGLRFLTASVAKLIRGS